MDYENTEANRRALEAKANAVSDLVMEAITAFLKGEAGFMVTDGPGVSKVVVFGSIPTTKQ